MQGLHNFSPSVLLFRLGWITILIMSAVYLGYVNTDTDDTSASAAEAGGLPNCFYCRTGWNWHALYYTLAFPVFMAESLLAFKVPIIARASYFYRTAWHLVLNGAALAMSIVGLYADVRNKALSPQNGSMYSLHSWTGTALLGIYLFQCLLGAGTMVFRSAIPPVMLQPLSEWHAWGGKLTLLLGLECCINGWMDMQMMMVMSGQPIYSEDEQIKYSGSATAPPVATFYESGIGLVYWFFFAMVIWVMWPASPREPHASALPPASGAGLPTKGEIGIDKASSEEADVEKVALEGK